MGIPAGRLVPAARRLVLDAASFSCFAELRTRCYMPTSWLFMLLRFCSSGQLFAYGTSGFAVGCDTFAVRLRLPVAGCGKDFHPPSRCALPGVPQRKRRLAPAFSSRSSPRATLPAFVPRLPPTSVMQSPIDRAFQARAHAPAARRRRCHSLRTRWRSRCR